MQYHARFERDSWPRKNKQRVKDYLEDCTDARQRMLRGGYHVASRT